MLRTALVALVVLASCSRSSGPPDPNAVVASNPSPGGPSADDEAHAMFGQVCGTCHGPGGKADGPGGATLNPRPRNFTDQAWQASVTDDELRKAIVGGGPAVGKSAGMPPNPQLQDRPDVVDALVKIVRSFGK